ncbi:MAG: hypothetical protein KF812_11300 [Fimbriimonadaceae bacterium]|nr:hypothetical protein [Fimbriimonadaceae bacterium]
MLSSSDFSTARWVAATNADVQSIFFSAGEASGDAYAAALIQRIQPLGEFQFFGVGGPQSRAAGMQSIGDSSRWGAVGIIESLKVLPRVTQGFLAAEDYLRSRPPGVFIPIDYGFMNIRLAKTAKANGWRVVYFIPPGSWRKSKQGGDLPSVSDAIITPFSWSADILNQMGAQAFWFGHPLKQLVLEFKSEGNKSGIAVLPGSRDHEVQNNLSVIAETVTQLRISPVLLAASPNLDQGQVIKAWEDANGGLAQIVQPARSALWQSRAAIVCSGTATLEAALAECPCVVMYRGSKATEIEYQIRKPKFDYISLPNILLGRRSVTELLQYDANAERIASELEPLYEETEERKRMLADFAEVSEICGPEDALDRSAEFIVDFARRKPY